MLGLGYARLADALVGAGRLSVSLSVQRDRTALLGVACVNPGRLGGCRVNLEASGAGFKEH